MATVVNDWQQVHQRQPTTAEQNISEQAAKQAADIILNKRIYTYKRLAAMPLLKRVSRYEPLGMLPWKMIAQLTKEMRDEKIPIPYKATIEANNHGKD